MNKMSRPNWIKVNFVMKLKYCILVLSTTRSTNNQHFNALNFNILLFIIIICRPTCFIIPIVIVVKMLLLLNKLHSFIPQDYSLVEEEKVIRSIDYNLLSYTQIGLFSRPTLHFKFWFGVTLRPI